MQASDRFWKFMAVALVVGLKSWTVAITTRWVGLAGSASITLTESET